MKKLWFPLLLAILVLGLILAGCSQAPASADGDKAQAGGQDSEKPIELTFSYFGAEMIPPGHWSKEAAKRVEEKTNGRVKINTYFSESLLTYGDTITGTASGVADIAFVDAGLFSGQFDLNMVFGRFIPATPPQEVVSKVFREMIDTYPELNAELEEKNLRWLSIIGTTGEHLHTGKKQVRVPADVKGMKIAVVGESARWFESLGAAPVGVAAGDFYMSLERGLVDGQWAHWPAIYGFKLAEVTKYHTLFGKDGASLAFTGFLINNNTWNSLPPDIQEIMVECYNWANDELIKANQEEVKAAIESAEQRGNTFIELTDDELNLWAETMEQINQAWIESTEAQGKPAQKLFDALFELIDKYNK
ncbi:MAG: TRAP transporter substrate-binding protein DctP [Peptococcaceae bacterium]|nr:TRAP transporter substrate-binding protein DctP [Peptococcaceae bacterium]